MGTLLLAAPARKPLAPSPSFRLGGDRGVCQQVETGGHSGVQVALDACLLRRYGAADREGGDEEEGSHEGALTTWTAPAPAAKMPEAQSSFPS